MRPHASVLRGARRPRRFRRELVRLFRSDARTGRRYDHRLEDEFQPELRALADIYAERARRQASIDALYGLWEVHV